MLLSRFLDGGTYASLGVFLLLASPLGTITLAAAQSNGDNLDWVPFDQTQFSGNATLDKKGDVQLFWEIGDEYSMFGVAARSGGYLALGFSEMGAMTGADIAVGYADDDGVFKLENRHATGFVMPDLSEDQQDNIRLIEGQQQDGVTSFIFEKKNTASCIQNQVNVAIETSQWFIYAFSDDNTLSQHQPGNYGNKYVKLGTGKPVFISGDRSLNNAKSFTLTQPEVAIPTTETTYCASVHRMPAGKKHYLLSEQPPITPSDLLHHIGIQACYDPTDELLEMLDADEPNCDWLNFVNPCNGIFALWGPGMGPRTYEEGYGKRFGDDLFEYVVFETHWNNPEGIEGEVEAVSYSFLYTDEPVETEIGQTTLGDAQLKNWFLEPGKELAERSTVCTPECTETWPEEGITVFSIFHHMHFRGQHMRVQIIRDGKEITPLSTLRNYEYPYQFFKELNHIQLLPGDKLIHTCWYDTTGDTEPVPSGPGSQDEMCASLIEFYPATSVLVCTQWDMGNSTKDGLSGTVGFCLHESEPTGDLFESSFLTSSFESLPEPGNMCSVANSTESTEEESSDSGDDDNQPSAASSTFFFSSNLWITLLSLPVVLLAFEF